MATWFGLKMPKGKKTKEKQSKVTRRPRLKGSVKRKEKESERYLSKIADLGANVLAEESKRKENLIRQGVSPTIARNVARWESRKR